VWVTGLAVGCYPARSPARCLEGSYFEKLILNWNKPEDLLGNPEIAVEEGNATTRKENGCLLGLL
jgi:hypothetical protein